jgi:cyclopropane-fatty-acyl-phospholipid synthase
MKRLLDVMLRRIIRCGRLEVTWADGSVTVYGTAPGRRAALRFHTKRAERSLILNPELKLGELYVDGEISFPDPGLVELLCLVEDNDQEFRRFPWVKLLTRLRYATRRMRQANSERRAKANAAHHYDIDERLYRLFLDADMQYSCAYFAEPDEDIDAAQAAKKRHLAAKLALAPGQKLLDIGCGWGGLGLSLARVADIDVTGVTLAAEQHRVAQQRAREEGLAERVHFAVQDYRTLTGPFDRIISVGMFEHVGVGHYEEFFDHASRLLADDGVMVLHSIGRFGPPGSTNPWISKYIFPGGYIPALSEMLPVIERSGLLIADVEVLRLHYAETLKAWRERFRAKWNEAAELFDERFCRMWDFYLAGSESSFRGNAMMVFQLQLVKKQDAVPLTRDYLHEAEKRLEAEALAAEARPRGTVTPLRSVN